MDGVKQDGRSNDNHLGRPDKMIVAHQHGRICVTDVRVLHVYFVPQCFEADAAETVAPPIRQSVASVRSMRDNTELAFTRQPTWRTRD